MSKNSADHVKLSEDGSRVVDRDGNVIPFDDPRIVFVWPNMSSSYLQAGLEALFEKWDLRFRHSAKMSLEILKLGKNICTGRECLAFNAICGSIYADLENNHHPGEIAIYLCLDQVGPCENGAWPVIFDAFIEKTFHSGFIPMLWATKKTNFLGKGIPFIRDYITPYVLSDIFDEAESTLKCLAQNREQALEVLREESAVVISCFKTGKRAAVQDALKTWASKMKAIPLVGPVEQTPKVFLSGGLNLLFAHYPVSEFLETQGVIVKREEITQSLLLVVSEDLVRASLKQGITSPAVQFKGIRHMGTLLRTELKGRLRPILKPTAKDKIARRAMNSWMVIRYIESTSDTFRKLAASSGLLFSAPVHFRDMAIAGDSYLTNNAYTESSIAIGRYISAVRDKVYDGLCGIGSFNCQPAQNTLGVLRAVSTKNDLPFAAIDCDGNKLSSNQMRLLETLVVQAKRFRKNRNCA